MVKRTKVTKRKLDQKGKGKVANKAKTKKFFVVDVEDIRDSIATDDFEICGYSEDGNFILSNIGGEKSGRKFCDYGNEYQKLWHTHPISSKYYPSKEDLVKVLHLFSFKTPILYENL